MGFMQGWHWIVVLIVVLLVFGTKRLTSGMKDMGKAINEFKKGMRGEDDEAQPPKRVGDESREREQSRDAQAERERETR